MAVIDTRKVLSYDYLEWVRKFAKEHTNFKVELKLQGYTCICDEENISLKDAENISMLSVLYIVVQNWYKENNLNITFEKIGKLDVSKVYINYDNTTIELSRFVIDNETFVDVKEVEYIKNALNVLTLL